MKKTREIYDAGIVGNKSVLESHMADDYVETDTQGVLRDKAWNIQNVLGKGISMSYEILDANLREYGDTVLFFYMFSGRVGPVNQPTRINEFSVRVTDVFVKRQNDWRVVASHRTVVAKGANTK